MASKIKIKRSAVAGKVPLTTDLELSELAVNTNDGRLYTKKDDGTESIVEIGGPDFGSRNVTTSGSITVTNQGDIRLGEATANGSNYVALQAPASLAADVTYTLPAADGTSGQVLSTNGSGTLSWATAAASGASVTTSDTPPATPNDGDLWYDSVGGRTYVYYQDPNGSQWVDASPQGGGGSGTSITTGNTTAEVIDTGSDGRFVVTTEGTEALRVDSSRRLLVGTNTARANFYNATGTAQLQVEGITQSSSSISVTYNDNGVGGPVVTLNKSRSASVGGNTIVSSGDALGNIYFQGNDGSEFVEAALIRAEVDGTPGANDMPGRLIFATTADGAASPTERLRITQAGHFGFFGTDPATEVRSLSSGYGLRLLNNSYQESAFGNSGYWIFNNTASSGTRTMMFFRVQGVDRGSITSDGSTTAFNTSSDYRLKEDWHPVANAVDRLQLLNPVNFAWKETGKRVDGFIAHEVQAVVPEAITGEKDAVDEDGRPIYQGIDQSKLVPLLTAALQEAVARIEAQDTTIASLEARLTALEGGN